ncbi:unnamed protein product [Paramecium sonneborni]|uniref:Protein kinase domain-containing protein n=1 Tax=Paramecium sonneborni TaxID=65129 RepID=A0A8S1PUD4_9CILI|nr:unnamed protein product [Paramecium sonneborni]
MGNVSAFINYHTELTFSTDLNDQIHFCESISHQSLGKIQIWKIKENSSIKLFSFTRHVYCFDSTLLNIHQKRCSLQHSNLLQYYASTQTQPTFCGSLESQNFFFEYIPQTLQKVLDKREQPFPEIEIWKYLEQMVDVLSYLEENQCFHGNINLENIFVTEDNTIKILDQLNQQLTDYLLKSDVYDLAESIIELMTKNKFHKEFKETLKSLTDQYSIQLLSVLAKMLNKNPDKRPNFKELSESIQNRATQPIILESQKSESHSQTFQVLQNTNQTQKIRKQFVTSSQNNNKNQLDRTINYYPQKMYSQLKVPIPQVQFITKKQSYSNQEFEQLNFNDSHQQSIQEKISSPNKKCNMNGSQASTIISNQISFLETLKGNANVSAKQINCQNKINIKQHNSLVQNILIQDDLNKTSSTFTDQAK